MRWRSRWQLVLLVALLTPSPRMLASQVQTVCTITVNSADEKEAFARRLPASKFQFVELVENGRPDWLASACKAGVRCDMLVISGHYDGGNEFFSERLDVQEFLPVAELERASCSDSCAGLFSRLKEVYLFGCNTLNPMPQSSASAEIVRSLVREGQSRQAAQRQLQALNAEHGESSRQRMRQIFNHVPVIYGFSSVAPLGPLAASTLDRYFRASGAREIGQGRPSGQLLAQFAPYGMSVAQGMADDDPHADARQDMCRLADDRLPDAAKLDFVHELLQRHATETRLFLDRIERQMSSLDGAARRAPAVSRALEAIERDHATRARYLDFARHAAEPAVRVRMIDLAHDLGWLSADQQRDEFVRMLGELRARGTIGVAEVNLACGLSRQHALEDAFKPPEPMRSGADDAANAAVLACLGSAEGRERMLQALVSANEAEVQLAQAFFRHRPITEPDELRRLAAKIVEMSPSEAQVRAIETLGRHYIADREVLETVTRLFAQSTSSAVQSAIAGLLMRADRRSIEPAQLVRTLRENRRPSPSGDSMIDALIQRLELP